MKNHVKYGQLEVGDTVAEMHCHQTNFGIMKDWTVSGLFNITEELYEAVRSTFPPTANEGRVIANKYAQVVSFNDDLDGGVSDALVIYVYDCQYYMATLSYN